MHLRRFVRFASCAVLFVAPALLAAAEAPPAFACGAIFAVTADNGVRVPVPLESTEVVLDVKPGLLEAQVTQTFTNRSSVALEATYLYPLPERATVTQFELHYGDRVVRSEVREKGAARVVYDAAKTAGKKTALLEQRDPSLFSTAVANFLPGERVQVVVRFIQPLTLAGDTVEVRFPMVTGDRYFPADVTPGTEGNAAPNPMRRPGDLVVDHHVYAFDIQVAGLPVRRIGSSHRIRTTVSGTAPERHAIALANEITIPDRDLVLRIQLRREAALAPTVVTQRTATGDYGLVALFPPRAAPKPTAPRPRDVLFLFDCSGSMQGARLKSAKLGLERCIDALATHDRFQIVTFASDHQFYRPTWVEGGDEAFAQARFFARSIQIRGGTELQRALGPALEAFEPNDREQILVLLTDGDVGNGASLLNLVESRIGQVRLFAFGIGAAPNAVLVKQIAELGRGQARFVADDDDVAREMEDLFVALDAPVLARPRLTLLDAQGSPIPHTTFPERLPDVFVERPIQFVYRTQRGVPAAVQIDGVEGERPVSHRVALQSAVLRGDGLEKEFGARLFADTAALLRRAKSEEERALVRQEMLATALQFQLVTELTSRVAVDDRQARDPQAPLVAQAVAQYRPADQPARAGGGEVVMLTPFEVSHSGDGYSATGTTSGTRLNTWLHDVAASISVVTKQQIQDFAGTTTESALPFVVDVQSNPIVGRPGASTGALDGLPIATVVDPATISGVTAESSRFEIMQLSPRRTPGLSLTGRFGGDEFAAVSLQANVRPRGAGDAAILAVLSAATFGRPHLSALLDGEKSFDETHARLGAQARWLAGYGDMRLLRAGVERKLGHGLLVEAAVAWHELRREDALQFRVDSPTARQDGLGWIELDLLTAPTTRLADAVVQAEVSQNVRSAGSHTWSARARWHRRESDWLTPSLAATAGVRTSRELELNYRLGVLRDRLAFDAHLGIATHDTPGTTSASESTRSTLFGVNLALSNEVGFFVNASRESALPWASTGCWRASGAGLIAVAPAVETREGGQAGIRWQTSSRRLSATVGAFHENVSGHEYRDWSSERAQAGAPFATLADGGIRRAIGTRTAGDFSRQGWTGTVDFNPSRSLTVTAAWSVDGKNAGPYRGGNERARLAVRHEVRLGGLKGFTAGLALHHRNALVFDDGYVLDGGLRADAMFGYRLRAGTQRETLLQLNVVNLADRSWQLTRFAPDRGRQLILTVTQGF